jgi:cobalt-precorrin 5A hydrolase/precorrin-3B C17-methyltransferase
VIGVIAVTAAGRRGAERIAAALPDAAVYALPRAFGECDAIVCFLAAGAVVRLLAPLLAAADEPTAKHEGPAVVCVDEAQRYAIPLLGGHAAGANKLARTVAAILDAEPVITTATDATGVTPLDEIEGFAAEGDVAAVTRAILDGERVTLTMDQTWPLPAFPSNVVSAQHPEPPRSS